MDPLGTEMPANWAWFPAKNRKKKDKKKEKKKETQKT